LQSEIFTVINYGDDFSDDVTLRNESQVARVGRILLVQRLQPVVVGLGTGVQSWHDKLSLQCVDGVTVDSLAAGDADSCDRVAGHGEGNDVASLNGLAQQTTVG
jgi:hypothetical protein